MILGRTPREVFRTMSLPEALLVLRHARREQAAAMAMSATAIFHGSAAKWSREAHRGFVRFVGGLEAEAAGRPARPPARATRGAVASLFTALGIPVAA